MKKGFTLLEILLVIAAIGILAAIVIVAINPTRQLSQVRNATRQSDVNTLGKALDQYLIDTGTYPPGITDSYQEVCGQGVADCTGFLDLETNLVPNYLAAIPSDPQSTGDGSGYEVALNQLNNTTSVRAPNAEIDSIVAINNFDETLVVGDVFGWGLNDDSQVGDGTNDQRQSPVIVSTTNDWAYVDGGFRHTLALKTDNTLWAWGYNFNGQLGDGSFDDNQSPDQIGTETWQKVVAGDVHSVGIRTDGTLWAWGGNDFGQLGDGTTLERENQTKIGSDTDWADVAAGYEHTVAIKENGTMWAWGGNTYGEVGDGTTTQRETPVQIGSDTNWESVSAGFGFNLARKTDGTIWAWGDNFAGQLGDGTTTQRGTPAQIGTDTDWLQVEGGDAHSLAVKENGTLWAWGFNFNGQLGDGTGDEFTPGTVRTSPFQIGTDTDWDFVSAGGDHSTGIKN